MEPKSNFKTAIFRPIDIGRILLPKGVNANTVDRATENFEEASLDGDIDKMDQIADMLARRTETSSPRGRRRAVLDRTLDRLGANTKNGPRLTDAERDLVQRLRTGVAANNRMFDGLMGPLGDISAKDLMKQGKELANKLRSEGRHHYANAVESAVRELGKKSFQELPRLEKPVIYDRGKGPYMPMIEPKPVTDLDKMAEEFDEAAEVGDGAAMDRIMDELAKQIENDGSPRDAAMSKLERRLDRLGEMMRRFESIMEGFGSDKGAEKFDKFNETIQQLRSAVLGAIDGKDGLKSTLGDKPLGDLAKDVKDLLKSLNKGRMRKFSPVLSEALKALQGMMNRDEAYGKVDNDSTLYRARPMIEPF